MVHIDSTAFGSVTINGKKHHDVLIVGGRVVERNTALLHKLFGTSHTVTGEEAEKLLQGAPEVIVVGNGQSGVLKVEEAVKRKLAEKNELFIEETPDAIKRFNELVAGRKKVNALIHTTC